jgi:hypothetical protein
VSESALKEVLAKIIGLLVGEQPRAVRRLQKSFAFLFGSEKTREWQCWLWFESDPVAFFLSARLRLERGARAATGIVTVL